MNDQSERYSTQENWRTIQGFLPAEYRLGPDNMPVEEWWDWHGHSIHLDRFPNPSAPIKVILFHGVGTNGRQMSTILGAPLARSGFETVAIDMPGYGVTKVARGVTVTYDEWVAAANDFIDAELARDLRPVILYGLSAGGMLTYHAAASNRKVKGIVGMTFLDQRLQQVSDETAYSKTMNRIGKPLVRLAARIGLGALKVPMRQVSKMYALVNDKAALKACYADKTSAGNRVSMAFLASYADYVPAIEPEQFDICPILLTQPAEDRWTPLHLSNLFLDRIGKVPVRKVMLDKAGHYPIEQPGLRQMHDAIVQFAHNCAEDR